MIDYKSTQTHPAKICPALTDDWQKSTTLMWHTINILPRRHSYPSKSPTKSYLTRSNAAITTNNSNGPEPTANAPYSLRQKKATAPPRQQKHSPQAKRVSHDSKLDIHASIKITLEEAILGSSQKIKIEFDPARRPPHGTDTVLITIPQQCPDGHIITLPQKGFCDPAKQTVGHLHLRLKYAPHQRFSLRGNNIYLSVEIYPWDAATGMSYSIKTPGGRAELRISPGTHNWQTFTIKGHGMPDQQGRRGNLLVYPRIKQPTAVTSEQKRRWKALRASYGV